MKRLPTDLQILDKIYSRYYSSFTAYPNQNRIRRTKNFVSIDIKRIASDLKVDEDIIFGRLYQHLEQKYGYEKDNGSSVSFFVLRIGEELHCVNFPYLASILANLRTENRKFRVVTSISITSLLVSTSAFLVSIFK